MRKRLARQRRLRRLQMHRRRYQRYLRLRNQRRRMMKKLHMRRMKRYRKSLLKASRQMKRTRQMYKTVEKQILRKIHQVRNAKGLKEKNHLIAQLKTLINQNKAIRTTMIKKAMGQYDNLKKATYEKKVKEEVKKLLEEKAKMKTAKKIEDSYLSSNNKINVLKRDYKYKPKSFVRACKRAVRLSCLKFDLNKKECKKVYSMVKKRVERLRKVIQKNKEKRDALIKKNLRARYNQMLIQKTIKKTASKFEKNYNSMNKHRNILDVTCKMDPKSCNFFRRSFGDKVPMI